MKRKRKSVFSRLVSAMCGAVLIVGVPLLVLFVVTTGKEQDRILKRDLEDSQRTSDRLLELQRERLKR